MARSRNIKPGICENEDLAECSIPARYLFACMPMYADRDGRLEDRPRKLKKYVFGGDTVDVEPLLRELASHGAPPFIVRYQNEDGAFIQITGFLKHQSPHYSEKPSVIKPPILPESCGIKPPELREKERHILSQVSRSDPPIKRGPQPPDSLIPDSLIPSSLIPEKSKSASQGSRLSPEWVLPDDWKAWAMQAENWSEAKTLSVAELFKDHWLAKAGKEARKVDWKATWRTWVRRQKDFAPSLRVGDKPDYSALVTADD